MKNYQEDSWTFRDLVNPDHSALLVIDMQNDYCNEKGVLGKMGIDVSMVKEMAHRLVNFLTIARDRGIFIIHTRNIHDSWTESPALRWKHKNARTKIKSTAKANTWGAEWYEGHREFQPTPNEYVISKHRYSAFINTDLDLVLRSNRIRTLIITGTATNVCVESTAREGFMRDYNIVLVKDCVASGHIDLHNATLKNIELLFGSVAVSNEIVEDWSK